MLGDSLKYDILTEGRIALKEICMRKNVLHGALSISALILGLNSPAAVAQTSDADAYAEAACGNNQWFNRGFASYDSCYEAALASYSSGGSGDTPIGDGSVGGGGSGYGGYFGDGPGPYYPDGDNCTAKSRLCDKDGNFK